MSEVKRIQQLIEEDLDKAFELMDEVFQKGNSSYNALCAEYAIPPRDFQITHYKSRLKRFVQVHSQSFDVPSPAGQTHRVRTKEGKIYDLLCELNFVHQKKYFYAALKSGLPLIPFVIRGEVNRGQKWLCNRLIHQFDGGKNINEVIYIDFNNHPIFGLADLLQELGNGLCIGNVPSSGSQKRLLRRALEARLVEAPLFIIFENFYGFTQCPDFELFFETLEYWLDELTQIRHPCICFFMEHADTQYNLANLCLFTEYDDIDTDTLRANKVLKFVDLHAIKAITKEDIKTWLDAMHPEDYKIFSFLQEGTAEHQELLQKCEKQNFNDLIIFICNKLGYDYENVKGKWQKN